MTSIGLNKTNFNEFAGDNMGSKLQKPKPLYLQAYDQLRLDILHCNLRPGQRLTDQHLSEWLGISRTPVREAVRILCQEGLLANENGNVSVYKPTMEDVGEIYIIRSSLEAMAGAMLAVDPLKQKKMTLLYSLVEKSMKSHKANDIADVRRINTALHRLLVELSDSQLLVQMYETIDAKMSFLRNYTLHNPRNVEISIKEHEVILGLLEQGEPIKCKRAIQMHVLEAAKRAFEDDQLVKCLSDNPKLQKLEKYILCHLSMGSRKSYDTEG